ncbi:ATP-binding cassette domain-containing protein [Agrococcus sp. Marseille-Q4369]|nr:ATP-binding cassette domain-containing protein [Agrococcus sp. Marseille-Q4369]
MVSSKRLDDEPNVRWTSRLDTSPIFEMQRTAMLNPEADAYSTTALAHRPVALEITGLSVSFHTGGEEIHAVRDISINVRAGTTHAIVGESGSGKSVTMMSVLGLLPTEARVTGSIRYQGAELVNGTDAELRAVRGAEIGVIFQDPLSSLNPVKTVGAQILESMTAHRGTAARATWKRAAELLAEVGIPEAERRVKEYPHQFSGGMRQRVMIAMVLAAEPKVLIADEATTALDVTVQAQILKLVQRITAERSMTTIWISHDLGVVAQIADEITVMQSGRVVEHGTCVDIFANPQEQYTSELLRSMPRLDAPLRELPTPSTAAAAASVEVRDLEVAYQMKRSLRGGDRVVRAVDGVSLSIGAGETLGLVGESGSGKSTFARALLGLEPTRHGTVRVAGNDIVGAKRASLSALRRNAGVDGRGERLHPHSRAPTGSSQRLDARTSRSLRRSVRTVARMLHRDLSPCGLPRLGDRRRLDGALARHRHRGRYRHRRASLAPPLHRPSAGLTTMVRRFGPMLPT